MREEALLHAVDYIKAWLHERCERLDIPGAVVAISHQGRLMMNEAYGYANLEQNIPMTPEHVFRIASHSKTFTATAIMHLHEEGKLRLDDGVTDYLPWLKPHEDHRWSHVTLRQLLSHGAGVIRDGIDQNYWQLERPFPDAERFTREMEETPLILDNNTRMKYSNYGYTLLGLVIEAISGMPYNEFLLKRVVGPLGLKSTFPEYRPELHQPREEARVTGYTRRESGARLPIVDVNTHAMSPATGFSATAADLCTYFTAHMVGSGQLLSDESKKDMQRVHWQSKQAGKPSGVEYGLGLILKHVGKHDTFGHSGGFPGFITQSMADPQEGLVVVALTNAIDGPADGITTAIYKILDYFQENTPEGPTEHNFRHLEGVYRDLWSTMNIVATGDKVVSVSPDSWEPFATPEKLEYVDNHTFKVTEAGSFSAEGEWVHFDLQDDRVKSVTYTGATLWPKATWLQKWRQRSVIGK